MIAQCTVSVIVPTRNSAKTLEACLRSVRSQTYPATELIVVDNHSTDGTLAIARRLADTVETFGPERSAQRNRGARTATGPFLLFLDSDMVLSPTVVAECVEAISKTGAPAVIVPEETVGASFFARCRAHERRCYVGDDSVEGARFFDRSAFTAAGGFDEELVAMEDWDLTIRVAARQRLPRTSSLVQHDETDFRLGPWLHKKQYYAASAVVFVKKHGRASLGRANLIFRPAFLRSWRRLARHPVLTSGFLVLKGLESVAIAYGIVRSRAHS